jgi:hypothetical protein
MQNSHLRALKEKHERIERYIHTERAHPARDEIMIERMKKERLHLREEIERVEKAH